MNSITRGYTCKDVMKYCQCLFYFWPNMYIIYIVLVIFLELGGWRCPKGKIRAIILVHCTARHVFYVIFIFYSLYVYAVELEHAQTELFLYTWHVSPSQWPSLRTSRRFFFHFLNVRRKDKTIISRDVIHAYLHAEKTIKFSTVMHFPPPHPCRVGRTNVA